MQWKGQREGRRWNTILRVRKDKRKENICLCFQAEGKDPVGKEITEDKKRKRVLGTGPKCYTE